MSYIKGFLQGGGYNTLGRLPRWSKLSKKLGKKKRKIQHSKYESKVLKKKIRVK